MYIYWKLWYIFILDVYICNNVYGGNGCGGGVGGYLLEIYVIYCIYKIVKDYIIDKYLD